MAASSAGVQSAATEQVGTVTAAEAPEYADEMKAFRDQLAADTREQTSAAKEAYREMRRQQRLAGILGDDEDDEDGDDDSDVEVYYVR